MVKLFHQYFTSFSAFKYCFIMFVLEQCYLPVKVPAVDLCLRAMYLLEIEKKINENSLVIYLTNIIGWRRKKSYLKKFYLGIKLIWDYIVSSNVTKDQNVDTL